MAIGDRLKELLDIKDISQKELAASLNIAFTTLNGYINNKRQPDFETLKRIASYFDVSIDYLLEYKTSNSITAKEYEFILKLRKLDLSKQELILDSIDIAYKKRASL